MSVNRVIAECLGYEAEFGFIIMYQTSAMHVHPEHCISFMDDRERFRRHICGAPGHLRPQATRGGGPLTLGDAVDTTFAQRKSCRSRS